MNIYVGNLDFRLSEDDLEKVFSEFGAVESVNIISDKFSGRSKGFGFVTMEDKEEGLKAIEELHGTTLNDRDMVVNEARPKKEDYKKY